MQSEEVSDDGDTNQAEAKEINFSELGSQTRLEKQEVRVCGVKVREWFTGKGVSTEEIPESSFCDCICQYTLIIHRHISITFDPYVSALFLSMCTCKHSPSLCSCTHYFE